MKWTDQKPNRPGFYWFQGSILEARTNQPIITELTDNQFVIDSNCYEPSEINGQFAGPIERPDELTAA